MINGKGEWVYTCAEIGNALGIHPNTIRVGASRIYGAARKFNFTLEEARHIKAYFMSESPEQEQRRITALFDALKGVDE